MKQTLKTVLITVLLVLSLSSCKNKEEKKILTTPTITLNSDSSISINENKDDRTYQFLISKSLESLNDSDPVTLDLDTFKLDYSYFIKCYSKPIDESKYYNSDYSNVLYKEYTNELLDTKLINGLSYNDNEITYNTNLDVSNLLLSFDYNDLYNEENFKIKLNDNNELITINNSDFYNLEFNELKSIDKLTIYSNSPSLIDIKISNISYTESVSFNKDDIQIEYTKSCSNKDYFNDLNIIKKPKAISLINLLNNNSDDFFILEGYVLKRSNDNSLSSYLYDIENNKYIKIESYSKFNTGFSYEYKNNKINISYNQMNNLINNNEYYFNDGDYIKCLVYKDLNTSKYYSEVISIESSKNLNTINHKFNIINNNDSSKVTISFNKDNYSFNEILSMSITTNPGFEINKVNLIRFDGSKEVLVYNNDTMSYNFKVYPNDLVDIVLNKISYETIFDNNKLYFKKVSLNESTNIKSYETLYEIEDTNSYNNLSKTTIKKISGYILNINNLDNSITLVDPTNINEIKELNISSISKLNTAFKYIDSSTYYDNKFNFSELNLSKFMYVELLVLYNNETNKAYGELYSINTSKLLTDIEVVPNIINNSETSTISFKENKDIRYFNDTVTIKVTLNNNDLVKTLKLVKYNDEEINLSLDSNNEVTINLSFNDEIVFDTSKNIETYNITGDSTKDEIEVVYPNNQNTDGSIGMNAVNPLYLNESKGIIKKISIAVTNCLSGTLKVYGSNSLMTTANESNLLTSLSITGANTYSYEIELTSIEYLLLTYNKNYLIISNIKIQVEPKNE